MSLVEGITSKKEAFVRAITNLRQVSIRSATAFTVLTLATLPCRNSDLLRRGPDGQTHLHSNESNASTSKYLPRVTDLPEEIFYFQVWVMAIPKHHRIVGESHRPFTFIPVTTPPFTFFSLQSLSTIAPYNDNHE
jgi:hypothetical protein